MSNQFTLEQALHNLLTGAVPLEGETVPVLESLGRVLGEDLYAPHALPAWPQSAVDGYAVGTERAQIGESFSLISFADYPETGCVLHPGEAAFVRTGGMLPEGACSVVPHERTARQEHCIITEEPIKPGSNIKRAGEDYPNGAPLRLKGEIINPGCIALFSALGIRAVRVVRQPRLAVLHLAEQLASVHEVTQPDQIPDANGPFLCALAAQENASVSAVEIRTSSDETGIMNHLRRLADTADLVVTTGGTYSHGSQDAIRLFSAMGGEILFHDVPIQPGSHNGAARLGTRFFLSLSGNPAACAVGSYLFLAPLLRALQGYPVQTGRIQARCLNGFEKKTGSRRFVRGRLVFQQSEWQIAVLPGQKPSMFRSLIDCNALIDLQPGSPPVNPGDMVSVLPVLPLMDSLIHNTGN